MIPILIKASLALIAALLAVAAMRRAAASLRHLILTAAFAFLLLLPIVQRFAPAVQIPIETRAVSSAHMTFTEPMVARPAHAPPLDAGAIVLALYALGTTLLLAQLAFAILRLRKLIARATPWTACDSNVLLSDEIAVPMTFGSRIVLPHAAQSWQEEELARALRHEREHVRRHDWLLQLAARVACALYWPNPLVWIAFRRFSLEAERACDDAVIATFERTAYATQLVTLARNSRPAAALSMASRSKLATRIEAILDPAQRRGPHGRSAPVITIAAALTLLIVMAPARLIAAVVADDRGELLIKSAEAGDLATVQRLLASGMEIDTVVPGDGTPLIGAARGGQTQLAQWLLDRGAPIDQMVHGDENPLITAAMYGHTSVVALLIARDADVNARAVEGTRIRTPLRVARRGGFADIERMLVNAGAVR